VGLAVNTNAYFRNEALSADNTVVSVIPQATERRDWWEATAKLNLTFDSFNGHLTPYFFYPMLSFTALLTEDIFFPYVEVGRSHSVNTYRMLTTENPYLTPNAQVELKNTREKFSFKGGAKGHIGSMFAYDFNLSYAFVGDLYFFVTDTAGIGSYFNVLYDDVRLFSVNGNLRFQPSRALELRMAVRYHSYSITAPNRPSFNMRAEARYNLWDKLNIYANPSVMGGYKALSVNGIGVDRKAGFDLSIGADYKFFDSSSVFLQLNNLTANRYQLFNNYPTYGFNMLLGYTCIF